MVSLPVPLGARAPGRLGELPTQVQPTAWWPPSVAGRKDAVRRQLMFAISSRPIPRKLPVGRAKPPRQEYAGPEVECRILKKKNVGNVLSEVNEAVFTFRGKSFGLRMGLQHGGQYRWWEWVRIEELWSGPLCKAVRIGGFIPVEYFGDEYLATLQNEMQSKALHYHNWLRGEVYALMFANGVIHLTCRHVNNHLFDQGRDLEDTLPVLGFTCANAPDLDEKLDGSRTHFELGGVTVNLDEAAPLVSPEHPGALRTEGDVLIYQPYEGVEIEGDSHHRARTDGYIVRAADRLVPKGAARTLRFALGMGEAAPLVCRLVAPDWWYAVAGDLWPDAALPAHDDCDRVLQSMEASVLKAAAQAPRCFDSGILTRRGWEGEIPYSQFIYYYLSGDPRYFDVALRDAYHVTDIGFDHATETLRMHDYPFGAVAPPLYRTLCMTFGYLETGDPYLLDCSESGATHFYWIDRHNWPRRSYGRDAASVRSLIFLWDYTGKDAYLDMAREALGRAIQCQRPDGSYADQGGAVDHCGGNCNEIIKPWMAMLASDPMVDYLLRRPDDEVLLTAVTKTGEFLLNAQIESSGAYGWAYQYAFGDNPGDPREMRVHPDTFARHPIGGTGDPGTSKFLTFLTQRTGDPRYLEAWQRFYDTHWAGAAAKMPRGVGYTSNKIVQQLPYVQAHKWSARIAGGRVRIRPLLTGRAPSIQAEISTPLGRLKVKCSQAGGKVSVRTQCREKFEVIVELPGRKPVRMSSNDTRAGL